MGMKKTDGNTERRDGRSRLSRVTQPKSHLKGNATGEAVSVVQALPTEVAAIDGLLAETKSTNPAIVSPAKSSRRAGLQLAGVLFLFAAVGGELVFHGAHTSQAAAHRPVPIHARARPTHSDRRRSSKAETNPQLSQLMLELQDIKELLAEVRGDATGVNQQSPSPTVETNRIQTLGRWQFSSDFKDVWLGDEHYDLRGRAKARFCIQYLVAQQAFDADSARHLETEIDPFVREKCRLPPPAEIRIQHYFNDRAGEIARLRRELVKSAGRNGRFYLQVI
jgi:hypothetical protein